MQGVFCCFLASSDSNLRQGVGGWWGAWEERRNIFSENKPLMCLINFSTSAPISVCVCVFFPGNYRGNKRSTEMINSAAVQRLDDSCSSSNPGGL